MHDITLDKDILEINKKIAANNRKILDSHGILAVNIMGAIGSGKTLLIEKVAKKMQVDYRIGIIAGDVISELDAERLKRVCKNVIGINTGKECHLDAHLISHALKKMKLSEIDILFIENVGNLICPVDFDLGAHKNVTVVSVSEGDDTILKHPMIFLTSDAAIINKIDIAKALDSDPEKMKNDALKINPNLKVFLTSVKKDIGIDDFISWLENCYKSLCHGL